MSVVAVVLFAICACMSAYLYKQNLTLMDDLRATEQRIIDLENHKLLEYDQFNSRLNDFDSRILVADKLVKMQAAEISELVSAQVKHEQVRQLNEVVQRVGQRTDMHSSDIKQVSTALNALAANTIQFGDGNICVMAAPKCPNGMTKVGTFGTILHNPDNIIGTHFSIGSNYGAGWDWMHGSMCCKQAQKLEKPAAATQPAK